MTARRGVAGARRRLAPGTVRNYLSNALTKTGARCRIEAVRIAQDAGWLPAPLG
jgi:two-component system response regulator DesR